MANIDYIGEDALLKALNRQKTFSGIRVKLGNKIVFSEIGSDKAELIELLTAFWQEKKEANSKDQSVYEVILLDDKGKTQINYLYCLSEPETSEKAVKQSSMAFAELNIELGEKRKEVELLREKNTELELTLAEYEDEDNENELSGPTSPQQVLIAKLNEALTPERTNQLIDGFFSMFKKDTTPQVSGVTDENFDIEALSVVKELSGYDPKILHHLSKILSTAKSNKRIFDMIINEIDIKL